MRTGQPAGLDDFHAFQVFLYLVRSSQLCVNLFFKQFLLMVPAEPDNEKGNRDRDKYTQSKPPVKEGQQDAGQGHRDAVCNQRRDRAAEQGFHAAAICHHICGQFGKVLGVKEIHRKFPQMLRNPQPGRVRLLIRGNIGFAVIIFGGQKYQDGRNNACAPQHPDMVPLNGAAIDKGSQNFSENHNSYTERKKHSQVRQCAGEDCFFQICVTFV